MHGQNTNTPNDSTHNATSSFDNGDSNINMNTDSSNSNPTNTITPEMLQNFAKMFMNSSNHNSSNNTNTEDSRTNGAFD